MTVSADAIGRETTSTLATLSSRDPLVHPRSESEELLVGSLCGMGWVWSWTDSGRHPGSSPPPALHLPSLVSPQKAGAVRGSFITCHIQDGLRALRQGPTLGPTHPFPYPQCLPFPGHLLSPTPASLILNLIQKLRIQRWEDRQKVLRSMLYSWLILLGVLGQVTYPSEPQFPPFYPDRSALLS